MFYRATRRAFEVQIEIWINICFERTSMIFQSLYLYVCLSTCHKIYAQQKNYPVSDAIQKGKMIACANK